ncbi:MAG: TIGR01777 family oxidoreductase [Terriglobales bacterium]
MPLKVLLSGSSGLIGSALLLALRADGHDVKCLVRGAAISPGQVLWHPAGPLVPDAVSGFDAVIHLAGESIAARWTKTRKRRIAESRIPATQHLATALCKARQRPRVFICASAIGYYGDRGEEILREDSPSGQGFAAEVCRQWEAAAQAVAGSGIRAVQIRTGVVLSAAGGALAKMLPPFRMGAGGKVGSGRQWMSWIDLRDEVGAIQHLLAAESVSGPVNLVSPNPVRNAEFTKTLAAALHRPAIFPMPAFAARLAFGRMADELLLASQRVQPAKLKSSGYEFHSPDLRTTLEGILEKS